MPSSSIGFCVASTKNGGVERVRRAAHRHRVLLHRFEQRGLRLRRRAVDFVREQHVREDRTGHERPAAMAGRDVLLDDVGAGDVGRHQVRRELDALERQAERVRERAHQQRLRRARHAGDQAMSADQQRQQQMIDDVVLADDDLAHLRADRAAGAIVETSARARVVSSASASVVAATSFIFGSLLDHLQQEFLRGFVMRRGGERVEHVATARGAIAQCVQCARGAEVAPAPDRERSSASSTRNSRSESSARSVGQQAFAELRMLLGD